MENEQAMKPWAPECPRAIRLAQVIIHETERANEEIIRHPARAEVLIREWRNDIFELCRDALIREERTIAHLQKQIVDLVNTTVRPTAILPTGKELHDGSRTD